MIFRSPHPQITVPKVSLPDLILTRAEGFGSKIAFIEGLTGRSCTFAEFVTGVRRVAGGLAGSGFSKGDTLALMSPNSIEFGMMFLASALLGGINTTLNPSSTHHELASQAKDSKARYLFTTSQLLDPVLLDAPSLWKQAFVVGAAPGATSFESLLESKTQAPVTSLDPGEDLVILPYSSGTTGISKGVMLTHQNLVANLRQIATGMFDGSDTILGLPPFFHIYGLTVVLQLGLYLGATNVILPRFEMQSFVNAVETYGITYANLVPPLIVTLAKHEGLDPERFSSLKTVQSGAAPLPPNAAQAFSERFDCRVLQSYGLTETSPVTHCVPRNSSQVPIQSVGPPVAGTECRILDLDTGRELGPDQRGELHVRGPQVMKGYLNDPEKTATMIDSEGWLRTGDIAHADEAGNFYIVDRAKELIKYRAYPVAPAELEALLLTHPAVQDAAVVGISDDNAGELPKAFIVSEQHLDAGELMSWVAERVSPHKRIRRVEFVPAIPKSPSGKILRRVLREPVSPWADRSDGEKPDSPGGS